jgi:hypothetical protein
MDYQEGSMVLAAFRIMQQSILTLQLFKKRVRWCGQQTHVSVSCSLNKTYAKLCQIIGLMLLFIFKCLLIGRILVLLVHSMELIMSKK